MRSTLSTLLAAIVLAFPAALAAQATASDTTPAAAAKPAGLSCPIATAEPTEGEADLAREDDTAALAFYKDAVARQPDSVEAQYGLVRALLGKDQLQEANKTAAAMLGGASKSVLPEIAAGLVAYRMADFDAAITHFNTAVRTTPCEARGHMLAASIFDAMGYYASETKQLEFAHKLRPNDEEIRRAWIDSLPRKRREEELEKYLSGATALSSRDREGLVAESDHLKAHKEGECHIESKGDVTRIPFVPLYGESAQHIDSYGLTVAFNGKTRRMQIDTGASGITLSHDAAKRLGLAPEYRLHTSGVGDDGAVGSYLTHVEKIQIGDVTLTNCLVDVLEKPKGHAGLEVDGLIGLDLFGHWLATLDYPDRQVLLKPLPARPGSDATTEAEGQEAVPHDPYFAPEMKDWMHVLRMGHNILLPTFLNTGKLHYMIADTGASQSIVALNFARESGKAHKDDTVTFTGISGKVKEVYRLDDANLIFGRLRLPPTSFFAFDLTGLSHDIGTEISGFVGFETLSRLTITVDYRDNLMLMQYDPRNDPLNYAH